MMPLKDRIQVVTQDGQDLVEELDAYVGYSTGSPLVDNTGGYNREDLVILVRETVYDPAKHYLRHKGQTYRPNGAPAPHYRDGEPHHVTIPATRTTPA